MNSNDKKLIVQVKHRYNILVCIESFLIFLQTVGLLLCFTYVVSVYLLFELPDIPVSTGAYHLNIKSNDMNVICMIISVLLIFSRPKGLKDKRIKLKLAKKYLEKNGEKADFQKDIIEKSRNIITDVDRYYQKKKDKKTKEKIVPHEKRMVLRQRMILLGIPGISILTAVLIFGFGWNVPQTASIDLIIGYFLVIFEAQYYQILLKKEGVKIFSDMHRDMIEEGVKKGFVCKKLIERGNEKKKSKRERFYEKQKEQQYERQIAEQREFQLEMQKLEFKCYQKICFMTKDRKTNYCMVFGVAALAMNFLSLIITFLDSTQNLDFMKLFALPISSVNNKIALFFAIISIIFFTVDIILQNKHEADIYELDAKSNMEYSSKNYGILKDEVQNMMDKNLFSRSTLDVGRGIYDFNNDQLVKKCIQKEKNVYIPVSCMFTVEKSFPGRVPRYKLTALIFWLCAFCAFVWGRANLKSLVPISIGSIVIYDTLLVVNGILLWSRQKEWRVFEKEIEKYSKWNLFKSVNQDFVNLFLIHSAIISFLACIWIIMCGSKLYVTLLLLVGIISIVSVLGCSMKLCAKDFPNSKKSRTCTWVVVCVLGIMQNILQYVTMGKTNGLHHVVTSLLIILLLISACNRYYETISRNGKRLIIPINLSMLLLNGSCILGMLYWCYRPQEEFSGISLGSNILFEAFTLVVLIITVSRIIAAWITTDQQSKKKTGVMRYPYSIFGLSELFLIVWGAVVFIGQHAKIESIYYVLCVLFVFLLWGSTKWLKAKGIQVIKLHNLILAGMSISTVVYMIMVAAKSYILVLG